MGLLQQLSSRTGDRTAIANKRIARVCLGTPKGLAEIAVGLASDDAALVGDCAEVLTEVALVEPALAAPHVPQLVPLLIHKKTRVRWEAAHTLALCATEVPGLIGDLLPALRKIIAEDHSVIVRDYALRTVANYAGTGRGAARMAYPVLVEGLTIWDGRHTHHALSGLGSVVRFWPELAREIRTHVDPFLDAPKRLVQAAAQRLLRKLEVIGWNNGGSPLA